MHHRQGGIFQTLKEVMKANGVTYKALAAQMGVSEPTIKRIFQDQDCKLSRLLEICKALSIDIETLLEMSERQLPPIKPLSPSAEQALADNRTLLYLFMLLVSDVPLNEIQRTSGFSDAEVYQYLRQLEEIGLLRVGVENRLTFLIEKPIKWRLDGPLHPILVGVNQAFVAKAVESHNRYQTPFYSASRLVSDQSREELARALQEFYELFHKLASLDKVMLPKEELKPFKFIGALAPFDALYYFRHTSTK
jgi:DNA-binding Xre family transcriptional regulator